MHLLLRLLTSKAVDPNQRRRRRKPRLKRVNAMKNIQFDPISFSPSDPSSSPRRTVQSLNLPSQTSFRIGGVEEGEIDRMFRSLGLSSADDLAIPIAAWEAGKAQSSSDFSPKSRLQQQKSQNSPSYAKLTGERRKEEDLVTDFRVRVCDKPSSNLDSSSGGEIKGVLSPPPLMSLPVLDDACSTWDILRSLAPDEIYGVRSYLDYLDEESEEDDEEIRAREVQIGRQGIDVGRHGESSGTCSFTTSNDDDSSSTTTESICIVSPNGRFKRSIRSWTRGGLLGSGSFGTVFEGFSQ